MDILAIWEYPKNQIKTIFYKKCMQHILKYSINIYNHRVNNKCLYNCLNTKHLHSVALRKYIMHMFRIDI